MDNMPLTKPDPYEHMVGALSDEVTVDLYQSELQKNSPSISMSESRAIYSGKTRCECLAECFSCLSQRKANPKFELVRIGDRQELAAAAAAVGQPHKFNRMER
jgi:hypothetical protein